MLLSLIGIGLGMYGASQILKEPVRQVREKHIKDNRANTNIDILCDYVGIKKRDGVYPLDKFDDLAQIMRTHYYFKDNEIEIIKRKYEQSIQKQKVEQKNHINERYKELYQDYLNSSWENYYDYYTIKHWHTITKEEHERRLKDIYDNTFWGKISIEPPYLIKNPDMMGYIEVWHIRKNKYKSMDKYYDIAIKKLGY